MRKALNCSVGLVAMAMAMAIGACSDPGSVVISQASWRGDGSGTFQISGQGADGAPISLAASSLFGSDQVETSSALMSRAPGVAYPRPPRNPGCVECFCLPAPCLAVMPDPTPGCYDCTCYPSPCLAP